MAADPQLRPNGQNSPQRRRRPRLALWCLAVGLILGIATVISAAVDAITNQQAMALGLPAALLIVAGLITVAIPDSETGRRRVFLSGFRIGALLGRLRDTFRRPGDRN